MNGMASIENGHIHIQDPQPGGQAATIMADDSVLVFVNEVPIQEPVEVFSRTSIRVTLPLRTFPRYHLSLTKDPDLMRAWLKIEQEAPGLFYQLEDTPPSPFLQIKIQEKSAPLSAFEEIRSEILEELQHEAIVYGIQEDQLDQILAHPDQEPVCIAQGQTPVFIADRIEERYALPEPVMGQAALLNAPFQMHFPVLQACKAGEILVRRIPGHLEREGINIFGQKLPRPEFSKPLQVVDGTVLLQNEGLEALSRLEGIPSFNGRDIKVRPCQTYSDPIMGTRGAIVDVKGSVQIAADVLDQAQVWATQHIEIQGQVSHAQLEAEESIFVHGNTVKGHIASGGDTTASMRLIPSVEALLSEMQHVDRLFHDLKKSVPQLAQRPDKLILINLLKTQFPQLRQDAEKLWELLKSMKKLQPRKVMVLKVVLANLLNLEQKEVNAEIFSDWVLKLGEYLQDLTALENLYSHVYLGYVQGSQVISQGNIYILGEGCYNSKLQARQNIVITGLPGYCREGTLEAGENLTVRELGSPNGSRLLVRLSPHSRVYAQLIYPGVEFVFGNQAQRHILEKLEWVELFQENGQVQIAPLQRS